MAEFCFDCFKEMMETEDEQWRYILTNELELCEGCGNIKRSLLWKEDYQDCKRRYFLREKCEKKKKTTHRVDLLSLFGFGSRLHFAFRQN